ncbi:MAG: BrnA antitoxin family protein [Bacteroides sp.]|nr:BrnA antitoxin family protein [Prevotella sp.]MCM1408507.1 BrnA antitoxin family protein [Treponema brennaborense]MCM1469332.1 BrnA antitoxin family protein [Bacteroides sp.]
MKTMTLDELRKLPPLTAEEVESVMKFKNTDFSDCPKQTAEELTKFRPWYEVHNDLYKPTKTEIHIRIDSDVLAWFKAQGKGYQTKINAVLRDYAFAR